MPDETCRQCGGLGLGYVSPVSTLIRWFPHRRGMATGMAIMGLGGGAMIGAPLKNRLTRTLYSAAEYIGAVADVDLVTEGGRRFTEVQRNRTAVSADHDSMYMFSEGGIVITFPQRDVHLDTTSPLEIRLMRGADAPRAQ